MGGRATPAALITQVETAAASQADGAATPAIHARLAHKELLPGVQSVDIGYLDAELLVASRDDYGAELLFRLRQAHGNRAHRRGRLHSPAESHMQRFLQERSICAIVIM